MRLFKNCSPQLNIKQTLYDKWFIALISYGILNVLYVILKNLNKDETSCNSNCQLISLIKNYKNKLMTFWNLFYIKMYIWYYIYDTIWFY